MNIFLIHDSFGSPDGNWFPWLKKELVALKHTVITPRFPVEDYNDFAKAAYDNPAIKSTKQNLINWLEVFQTYFPKIDEKSVFVGHSLGAAFVIRVLEGLVHPVRACIFASGFYGVINHPAYDAVNRTFLKYDLNWERVRKNSKKFFCIASDNDPYVPQLALNSFAKQLGVNLEVILEGGHLNSESGYLKFPRILDIIKRIN